MLNKLTNTANFVYIFKNELFIAQVLEVCISILLIFKNFLVIL